MQSVQEGAPAVGFAAKISKGTRQIRIEAAGHSDGPRCRWREASGEQPVQDRDAVCDVDRAVADKRSPQGQAVDPRSQAAVSFPVPQAGNGGGGARPPMNRKESSEMASEMSFVPSPLQSEASWHFVLDPSPPPKSSVRIQMASAMFTWRSLFASQRRKGWTSKV